MFNGITINPDGKPLTDAVKGVISETLHAGHKMATAKVELILTYTAPKEDSETTDEAAAAGHGL